MMSRHIMTSSTIDDCTWFYSFTTCVQTNNTNSDKTRKTDDNDMIVLYSIAYICIHAYKYLCVYTQTYTDVVCVHFT